LVQLLVGKLGYDPFAGPSTGRLSVELGRDGSAWRATISAQDANGATIGTQELTANESDCSGVFSAVVAALSVMLGGVEPAPEPTAVASPPGPSTRPQSSPKAPSKPLPTPPANPPPRQQTALPNPEPHRIAQPSPRSAFELELAMDLPYIASSTGVCAPGSAYSCYTTDGSRTRFTSASSMGDQISGGLAPSSTRLLLSMQYRRSSNVAFHMRSGMAVGGPSFHSFPAQVEAGIRYWFGEDSSPVRAFEGADIGVASFDTRTDVMVMKADGSVQRLSAERSYGLGYASATTGLRWKLAQRHGLTLALSAAVSLPHSGLVLQPTVGYAHGW